jgi:hypothetical protein
LKDLTRIAWEKALRRDGKVGEIAPLPTEEAVLMTRGFLGEMSGLALLLAALLVPLGPDATAAELGDLVSGRLAANDSAAKSQVRIDKLSEDTDKLVGEYRSVLQRIDALRVYNHQMDQLVASQEAEMISTRRQIDDVELVGREVTPLMLAMIEALDEFVGLDVPFLPEERTGRISALRDLMVRADITNAERYRRIMEAYQIENEYGRTIEAYQGDLDISGATRKVDFLRFGRVAFLYQTLDGAETGVWDKSNENWTDASDYRSSVRKGLRMARKQAAPDLLRLPVLTPETVQ